LIGGNLQKSEDWQLLLESERTTYDQGIDFLSMAGNGQDIDISEILKSTSQDVNWQDESKRTAIFEAAIFNRRSTISLLCDSGADINVLDEVRFASVEIVQLLD